MKIDMEFKGLEELVKAFESAASDEDIAQVNKTIAEKGEPVVQRIMSGKSQSQRTSKKVGEGSVQNHPCPHMQQMKSLSGK